MSLTYKIIESPVGKLKLVASDQALVAILWEKDRPRRVRLSEMVPDFRHPVLVETELQLREYFSGKRKTFSIALDLKGLACSTGAACSSGAVEPSHVLTAIGLPASEARASIRFSLGRHTTESEINAALELIPAAVAQLRKISPTYHPA